MHLGRPLAAALVMCALGCGGRDVGNPAAPVLPLPTAPTGTGLTANVRVVSTLTDQPVNGVSATGASVRSTTSDADGRMTLEVAGPGRYAITVTAAQFVTRRTTVAIPGNDARLDLIPSSFDLVAFDQMFRGVTTAGQLAKWPAAPALVVQRTGLLWTNSAADRYLAEDEQWTDADIDGVIADLTFGLRTISAGVFPAFSEIRVEQAVAGTTVTMPQAGAIVVARYRGLRGPSGDRIGGLGKMNVDAVGVIRGGLVMIDRDGELQSASPRPLRVHELGHTMGLSHVTSRDSFMRFLIDPNDFDKDAFRVAARRTHGNRSPDVDRMDFTFNSAKLR
jgi:Ca2+-binding RTX toxin-like protein